MNSISKSQLKQLFLGEKIKVAGKSLVPFNLGNGDERKRP